MSIFRVDEPIEKAQDDILDRKNFSEKLAKGILGWEKKEHSLVISLCGEWGSGKTSLINMVTEHISSENANAEQSPIIIEFKPWWFSGDGEMRSHFFSEIAKELKIKDKSVAAKEASEKMELYFGFVNVLSSTVESFSPILAMIGIGMFLSIDSLCWKVLGSLIVGVPVLVNAIIKYCDNRSSILAKSITTKKEEITKAMEAMERSLLIIIDDIDRLTKPEIKEIFKLVRLNADFPNTIYLLSFDRGIVERSLPQGYIEKIVQVQYNVPQATTSKIWDYLQKELERVTKKYEILNDTDWQTADYINRLMNIRAPHFKYLFRDLRGVKRFLNGIELSLPMLIKDGCMEVHLGDFLSIETIRMFSPKFHSFIASNKNLFTKPAKDEKELHEKKEQIDAKIKELAGSVHELILDLTRDMFPQIKRLLNVVGEERANRNKLRICSADIFDRYFTMTLDTEDISQYEINEVLKATSSRENFTQVIENYVRDGRLAPLLDRLTDSLLSQGDFAEATTLPKENMKNVVLPLLNIYDTPKYTPLIYRFVSFLLSQNGDSHGRVDWEFNAKILKSALVETNSIGWFADFYIEDSTDISDDDKKELRALWVNKIKSIDLDILIGHPKFIPILCWLSKPEERSFLEDIAKAMGYGDIWLNLLHEIWKSCSTSDPAQRNSEHLQIMIDVFVTKEAKAKLRELKEQNQSPNENFEKMIDFWLSYPQIDQRNLF